MKSCTNQGCQQFAEIVELSEKVCQIDELAERVSLIDEFAAKVEHLNREVVRYQPDR